MAQKNIARVLLQTEAVQGESMEGRKTPEKMFVYHGHFLQEVGTWKRMEVFSK